MLSPDGFAPTYGALNRNIILVITSYCRPPAKPECAAARAAYFLLIAAVSSLCSELCPLQLALAFARSTPGHDLEE